MNRLPRPPGMRLDTLPRKPQDKPQEVSVAVNPCDPRNAIISFHQAMREGSDHHPDIPVHLHIAWTADGGGTWTIAEGTTHEHYLRSLDAAVTFDVRGHAYVAYIAMDEMAMTTRHGEFLGRSLDGGRTWQPPVALLERREGGGPFVGLLCCLSITRQSGDAKAQPTRNLKGQAISARPRPPPFSYILRALLRYQTYAAAASSLLQSRRCFVPGRRILA